MCISPTTNRRSRQSLFCRIARRAQRLFAARQRDGITLIELLVVVAILGILMGLTATVVRPLREGRDIREGSRMVNAYLAAAQARAMDLQRPVGVWIRRSNDPNDPNDFSDPRFKMALELYMAEVPPPYMGDDLSSHAMVNDPNDLTTVTLKNVSRFGQSGGNNTYVNITKNDYIRLDFKGPFYRIVDFPEPVDSDCDVFLDRDVTYLSGGKLAFQVFRYGRPSQSAYDPLELPSSVAIDIASSGFGRSNFFYSGAADEDVAILFTPSGGIELVIDGDPTGPVRVSSAAHLLISRPDLVMNDTSLQDGNSRWVSMGHLTGRMTTSEIRPLTEAEMNQLQTAIANNDLNTERQTRAIARQFAAQAQTMGGR